MKNDLDEESQKESMAYIQDIFNGIQWHTPDESFPNTENSVGSSQFPSGNQSEQSVSTNYHQKVEGLKLSWERRDVSDVIFELGIILFQDPKYESFTKELIETVEAYRDGLLISRDSPPTNEDELADLINSFITSDSALYDKTLQTIRTVFNDYNQFHVE